MTMDSHQIRLLSFDLSSSLVDWREMLEPFLGVDAQNAAQQFFSHPMPSSCHGQILAALNLESKATPDNAKIARHPILDKIQFYEDVRHLHMLRHRCALAAVGDFDSGLALEISSKLGIAFDRYICSADIGSFSDTEDFWQFAAKDLTRRFKLQPHQWLHVSSASNGWLPIARKHGIRTGFVPRPSAGSAAEMMMAEPDLLASDLNQLEFGLTQGALAPVRYRVTATAQHSKTVREFIKWMHREHGEELLSIAGCTEFRVFQSSPTQAAAEYIFRDQDHLNHYLEHEAPKLRAKGLEYFPPELMQFARDTAPLLCGGNRRKSIDFGGGMTR
jgi:hypothetical protein